MCPDPGLWIQGFITVWNLGIVFILWVLISILYSGLLLYSLLVVIELICSSLLPLCGPLELFILWRSSLFIPVSHVVFLFMFYFGSYFVSCVLVLVTSLVGLLLLVSLVLHFPSCVLFPWLACLCMCILTLFWLSLLCYLSDCLMLPCCVSCVNSLVFRLCSFGGGELYCKAISYTIKLIFCSTLSSRRPLALLSKLDTMDPVWHF